MTETEMPTMPEVSEEAEVAAVPEVATDNTDYAEFAQELEKIGVSNPSELAGIARASKEAGQLANLLGEERKTNKALRDKLEQSQITPKNNTTDDFMFNDNNVDIRGEIRKALREENDAAIHAQQESQQAVLKVWNTIQTDEDYENVKGVWDVKIKDPNFVYAVQSGQVDPLQAYNKVVRDFYKGYLKKSAAAINKLQGKTITQPIHVESQAHVPTSPAEKTAKEAMLKEFNKQVNKGTQLSEDDELFIIDSLLAQ